MKSIVKLTYFFVHYVKIWSFLFIWFDINLFIPIICKHKSTQNKMLSISKYGTIITLQYLTMYIGSWIFDSWWMDGNYTHKECIVCECRGQCMVNVMWIMRKQRTQRVKCKWNANALNRTVNTNEYDLLILNGIGQHAGKTYLSFSL